MLVTHVDGNYKYQGRGFGGGECVGGKKRKEKDKKGKAIALH